MAEEARSYVFQFQLQALASLVGAVAVELLLHQQPLALALVVAAGSRLSWMKAEEEEAAGSSLKIGRASCRERV